METIKILYQFIVPILAAIIGVALPLLINSINKIDEKYHSTRMLLRFKKERIYKSFPRNIIITLIISLYVLIAPRRIVDFRIDFINDIVDYSAVIIAALATIMLVIQLIKLISLIMQYYQPYDMNEGISKNISLLSVTNMCISNPNMLKYIPRKLRGKINTKRKITDKEFSDEYKCLVDASLAVYKDSKIWSEHGYIENNLGIYTMIKNTEPKLFEPIIYDSFFYNIMKEFNVFLCKSDSSDSSPDDFKSVLDYLDLFKPNYRFISSYTYSMIWDCILFQAKENKEDWIIDYWTIAHNIFFFNYKKIEIGTIIGSCDDYKNYEVTTDDYEKLMQERRKFILFHLYLASYLLYKKKYELVKHLINYQYKENYSFIPSDFLSIIEIITEIEKIKKNPSLKTYISKNYHIYDNKLNEQTVSNSLYKFIALQYLDFYNKESQNMSFTQVVLKDTNKVDNYIMSSNNLKSAISQLSSDKDIDSIILDKNNSHYKESQTFIGKWLNFLNEKKSKF